jgi:putative PIN family toxin of toxin-antitoxin system
VNGLNLAPRVVFDCVTVLQGAARPSGPAAACLKLVESELVQLCLSPEIIAEIREVLQRPKLRVKFPILTAEWVESVLSALEARAEMFPDIPRVIELPRDPKDEPYLNLAIASEAQYLVTRDKDLLDLMDRSTPDGAAFQDRFPQLLILDPVSFLQRLS